jgi:hypothetical protein
MNMIEKTELTGHPAKLKSGEWGVHINGRDAKHGDIVRIKTKAGKEWESVVDRVVWTGEMDGKPCALATLMPEHDGDHAVKKAAAPTAPNPAADDTGAFDDDEPF